MTANDPVYFWNGRAQDYLSWCNRCQSSTEHSAVNDRCLEHR